MSKSMIVAKTDFKNALDLRFVKYGLIMAAAFGPVMNILMFGSIIALMPPGELGYVMLLLVPMVPALLAMFSSLFRILFIE